MSSKDQLLSIISATFPEFNEDDCTFVIEVFGQNGGFNSITSISVLDADEEEINGTFDINSVSNIDLVIQVIDDSGVLKWGGLESTITVSYQDGTIEVHNITTNEYWGEL